MSTTPEDIRSWLKAGGSHYSHMIVVTDEFDYEDYPVYVQRSEDVNEIIKRYQDAQLSKVMEVYDLSMSHDDQLNEKRAWHPTAKAPENDMPSKYPEHEKQRAAMESAQSTNAFGEFLEWLSNKYVIAEFDERDRLAPVRKKPYSPDLMNSILAEYFDIDPKKISDEKDAMLEEIREQNMRRDLEEDLKELQGD